MAPSFFTLPPEIRVKVYRYLLEGIDIRFYSRQKPAHHNARELRSMYPADQSGMFWCKHPGFPRAYNTGILSTCHKVYHEAIAILYEEAYFSYDPFLDLIKPKQGIPKVYFSFKQLDMIRNLRFIIESGISTQDLNQVAGAMHYFSKANCSLKRLTLDFLLNLADEWIDHPTIDLFYMSYVIDTGIAKALSEMKVSDEIEIKVQDTMYEAGQHFEPWVSSVAAARSWECYKQIDQSESDESRPIPDKESEEPFIYWDWFLRPPGRQPSYLVPCQLQGSSHQRFVNTLSNSGSSN